MFIQQKRFWIWISVVVSGLLLVLSVGICGAKTTLTVWGGVWMNESTAGGPKATAEALKKAFPEYKLEIQPLSVGVTGPEQQKLMIAVAGGNPPDIVHIDRYTVIQWATRGALMPLDEYVEDPSVWDQYVQTNLAEALYKGKTYAFPTSVDVRGIYWNKDHFKEVGLDPERPPKYWDELLTYAKKLTKYKGDTLERIGFSPFFGPVAYMFEWQNGGTFMGEDITGKVEGAKILINSKENIETLEFLTKLADAQGGAAKLWSFQKGFQSGAQSPFIIGILSMMNNGNWVLGNLARYAPYLNFGYAECPVPRKKGAKPWMVAGGWAFAIPRGVSHPEASYELGKWLTGVSGWKAQWQGEYELTQAKGKYFIPNISVNISAQELAEETYMSELPSKFQKAWKKATELLEYGHIRPLVGIGGLIRDEHMRARQRAIYHEMSPKEALEKARQTLQKELDRIYQQ